MVGQYGILLAISIIKDHFGEIVSNVCNCLLRRGSLQIQEIARDTSLKQSQVRNCLLVLIQHNCVQAFSYPSRQGDNVGTFYTVVFDNIIHRMRFTKFLDIISTDFGPQCVVLLEGLLQHGRLTFEQLVERSASKPGNDATKDTLLENFNNLVQAHFVERCPKPEPLLLPEIEENSRPKRRGSKFSLENMTLEKHALEAATLSNAERFMEITDTVDDGLSAKGTESFPHAGEKRKHGDSDVDGENQVSRMDREVLWRASFEKFVHCLKKKRCIAHKRSKLGIEAAMVLEALMESSGYSQDTVRSSVDTIFERLGGKPQGHIKNLQHARAILEELGCLPGSEERTADYTIDLKEIIKDCQLEEVESLILGRYGQDAIRIFRLLARDCKPLETDKISDMTLVDKKNVLGVLLMLWKNKYLHMEKMLGPTQKSYFLWKVNRDAVWDHLVDEMYHAALNLNQRIVLNYEKNKEIADCKAVNILQKKMQTAYYKRKWLLECTLLKLDDSLLLFHDFAQVKADADA